MKRIENYGLEGIYPATVCPLTADLQIDEVALAAHLSSLDRIAGIKGFLINGHAGENFLLAREEKRRVIEVVRQTVSDKTVLVCGVNAESTAQAVIQARDVAVAGGDAIMIFPPNSWAISVDHDMILAHHEAIVEATDLPIFLYQAPVSSGPMAFSHDVIRSLIALPRVVAIKEGSWEVAAYEANRRLVKTLAPSIAVMASGDEHLLTSFVLGSEGSIVSLAIVVPEVIVSLHEAVRRGDLKVAREAHEVIYPLAKAIYGTPPSNHATARLKTCLKLLGRLDCDAMRLPVGPLPEDDVARLRRALSDAGLQVELPAKAVNG
jgi:4-hydroxy-tetrahydrodipicolinate synthase